MVAITYDVVDNSSFLDANAFQLATNQQFTDARAGTQTDALFRSLYGATSVTAATGTDALINVALTLNRENDPTALLESSWAERQVALASQTEVWNTYGANPLTYQAVIDYINAPANGIGASALLTDPGYISSAESRTIWLQLTPAQFESLFNTPLLTVADGSDVFYAWAGNLSLPESIFGSVRGLWVDQNVSVVTPAVATGVSAYTPPTGDQGIGNGGNAVVSTPAVIADAYNFPLDSSIATPAIALVEPPTQDPAALLAGINAYRAALNLPAMTAEQFQVLPGADPTGWTGFIDETALDISVVASAAPNSTQLLYSFVGQTHFTAYQQAIWDLVNNPGILTSSFPEDAEPTPNSLFYLAYSDLFTDAALRNMSVFLSSGDGGSQTEYGSGSPLLRTSHTVSTAIVVGGTSISTLASAQSDPTLATGVPASDLVTQVMSDTPNLDLLMAMTAAGLTTLPTNMVANSDPTQTDPLLRLFETTWNNYYFSYSKSGKGELSPSYSSNNSSSGGVDTTQGTPSYQTDFGLTPTSIGPTVATGRGAPDVSALASGNAFYYVLSASYLNDPSTGTLTHGDGGTSAATPLWASLTAQFDAVFENQHLPQLGYYNDLLYMAAAIAPGAFNDISLGNNISTYYVATKDTPGAVLDENSGDYVVPTGLGFDAESGYDYTTGLGSPNGLLLARALTAIAHAQIYSDAPAVLGIVDTTHAVSDASQTLLVQSQGMDGSFSLSAGGQSFTAQGGGGDLAWTSRLAQQSLQSDFDPDLVRIFDGVGQATPGSIHVANGAALSATSGTDALALYQAALTSAFGFAAFGTEDAAVTLARPVAIAETAGGANSQDVVVRLRQNGADETHLTFYKVDDLNGDIGGLAPGAAGYADAAQARAYHTVDGQTSIDGPGWGNYAQTEITRVNTGDIIAMKLTNGANTFWGFAQANEQADGAGVTHLWSYGLNTWGWEDLAGGGDRDYNDLIVQLDFTSTSGDGWLI
ncbi:MAG TPA: hypothetical protein PLK13_17955 [Xanthobacteraceae bacterium]|nr:MAG: hypothetical protein B7Z41_04945 [Rhizobiales bacterium 12-66-7]HQS10711.1 hypothetical protein [Xanthobacteraceae bacterium]HQS49036.1 hypothetical protein [Xanthobacteraceae bacterium]